MSGARARIARRLVISPYYSLKSFYRENNRLKHVKRASVIIGEQASMDIVLWILNCLCLHGHMSMYLILEKMHGKTSMDAIHPSPAIRLAKNNAPKARGAQ